MPDVHPFNDGPRLKIVEVDPSQIFSPLAVEDEQALVEAVRLLEYTSMTARLTHVLGKQISGVGNFVPARVRNLAGKAASLALRGAMKIALKSLDQKPGTANTLYHKTLATASGAAGGALGIAALPIELPISTTIILRAIADIARSEGENLKDPETALACMEVFALGGRSEVDNEMESAYFAARAFLSKSISDAAKYLASQGAAQESAPVFVKLITQIAARFGVVVTQKAAAQAVPVLGAIAGASINYAFVDHFQGLARGHFTVRRLERRYSPEQIRLEYGRLVAVWRANRETE
ncbi:MULTISPECIES: EcsC family protein [unclassified Beijerinckia]|uniref:EcsC family protein n=1 Tax=unclassified Beijerinckia TaxID=2638183 RepID=UPI00089497C3|nr:MULTISPECIES: EcsC family protein [unclassified Beijerinckia]MDH7795263.1 hypothetical protein [Beijerinckia sp. GAS462]SEB94287.1 EcsC protein family protein [Beijerinckia sp. 28-YEA-48]